MDAGRFQGLEKPGREAHGKAVLDPPLAALAGGEAQDLRVGQRVAVQSFEQLPRRFAFGDVRVAENIAVARSVLQRNAPLPAGFARGRTGEGRRFFDSFARDGRRAIVREPMAPIVEAGCERTLDQQPAEARAVDEEIACNTCAVGELDVFDVPAAGVLFEVDDASLATNNAAAFGIAP